MAKRRVNPDSDDEQAQGSSPASKRARTEDDVQQVPRTQSSAARKGKGKARAEEPDSSDDEDQEMGNPTDHIDDDQFEEEFHERIEKAVDAKRSVVGGIADHGIIESIEMHQFMCHRFLSFQFGPQINFIIGHNGSGKSAVLSAITIALGGKSTSTGRGSGLKAFIREGQSAAEVTISLKNQGEEAYKPNEYGKSILITRRFTKEGNSSWKIRGVKNNTIISTKREELSAICDHMNIQVDNPMNVLTQDAARQFLSASTPADKYKFFLRGTQLSQLATEYETCLENITNTSNVLKNKKDAIPDLKQSYREANAKYQEAAQALKIKERARELKVELAWAHVRMKENDLQDKMEDVEQKKRQLEKINNSLAAAKVNLEEAGDAVRRHDEELEALGSVDDLDQRKNALKKDIKVERDQVYKFKQEEREINTSVQATDTTIADLQRTIDAEMARAAADTQEKRDDFNRRMEAARARFAEKKALISDLDARKQEATRRVKETQRQGEEKDRELQGVRESISRVQNSIQQLQRTETDKFRAFGEGVGQAIQKIPQMKWHGDVPLGPLGRYVKVKDPNRWADLLAQQLRGSLVAFAITDSRDREPLHRLLAQCRVNGAPIIIYEKDLFDYSQGEPDPDVLTVVRAMEFENPYVERILINNQSIEKLVLATSRREAEQNLRRIGGGFAWTLDLFNVRRFAEGGGSTNPMGRKPERSQMLRNEDTATRQKHYEDQKREFEAQYQTLSAEIATLKKEYSAARQEEARLTNDSRAANSAKTLADQEIRELQQEASEDTPVNIQGILDAKRESEDEKAGYLAQFEDIVRRKAEHERELERLTAEENQLRTEINSFNERQNAIVTLVHKAAEDRMKAQQAVQHYQRKDDETKGEIEAAEALVTTTTEEFETWTNSAAEIGPRVETRRKPEDIQRQMDTTKRALQEREKKQGASVDEIIQELNNAREKLERAQKDYKQMVHLNKILKASLIVRLQRWQEFRRHIALRCKLVFRYNLSQRGYFGNILFNHSDQTLSLKVQTDDQLSTQNGSKEKDPRSLSGGEKSFSTICLLLSLWESIGCPLRCLDEFDVFMDAVNRRISMKMMIDTANQSDKKQYILITPQDMNNIKIGPTVRVHRMTDPERGQGILAMS